MKDRTHPKRQGYKQRVENVAKAGSPDYLYENKARLNKAANRDKRTH